LLERPGLRAARAPHCPDREVANGVVYEDPDVLRESLPELRDWFAEHGCAWVVWAQPGDYGVARACEEFGNTLYATCEAMGLELDGMPDPVNDGLDWAGGQDSSILGPVNDVAYGFGDGSMIRAIGAPPPGTFETYSARHEGVDDAAVLGLYERRGNAQVVWVATRPEAAGHRLAGRLLGHALAEARGRGCETATLEATEQGHPAYAAAGFRPLGQVQMWVHGADQLVGAGRPS